MLQGKVLFKEIFFNHQMLMPYISYGLQIVLSPTTMYQYVLYHRLFVILFSLALGLIIVYRFSYIGFFFVVLYELTKYYCFGNLFLAESLIVYPLVYLFGISWMKLRNQKVFQIDFILSGIFGCFILFLREPFIPVTLLLVGVILWKKNNNKIQVSVLLGMLVTAIVLIYTVPIKEYFYQITTVNFQTVASYEARVNNLLGGGLVKSFLYPVDIFLEGKHTYFRMILIIIDVVFFISIFLYLYLYKKILHVVYIFFVLGLCAIRFVMPGTQFYEAYRLLPWYGIFLMATWVLIDAVTRRISKNSIRYSVTGLLGIGLIMITMLPQSFIWEKIERDREFSRNYGQYTGPAVLMNYLAEKDDSLFVEGWDSMIYLEAKIPAAYPYVYYYPIMNSIPTYVNLKDSLFMHAPPSFYYICYDKANKPELVRKNYIRLQYNGSNTCIHISKEKVKEISPEKINIIKQQGYTLYE
jgi:hypothetical protein